eukprot:scaffold33610_cov52-Phaeocystis_antarctica.AAC.3
MITSPLRSRWQAHGEVRIAVTSDHAMISKEAVAAWAAAAALKAAVADRRAGANKSFTIPPRCRPHLRLSFTNMAKRAFASPFHDFCQEQRPLLPADLKGSEREQLLGQRWQALSPAAKAKRKVLIPVFTCGREEHALGYPPRLSRRRQWRIS